MFIILFKAEVKLRKIRTDPDLSKPNEYHLIIYKKNYMFKN